MDIDKLDKLAKLVLYDVPIAQCARVMGVSEGRISQIKDTDEFQTRLAELASQDIDKFDTLNRGWDAVEEQGLLTVLATLRAAPDPEFALKAAALANRASRKGHLGNRPLVGQHGMRAVIQLNATYVEQLQQNFTIDEKKPEPMQRKQHNMLSMGSVQRLLKGEQNDVDQDVGQAFAGSFG